jgi:DNA repair exonuclease SbcCD ATPase subunit
MGNKIKMFDKRDYDFYDPAIFVKNHYPLLGNDHKNNFAWWFDDSVFNDAFYMPEGKSAVRDRLLKPDFDKFLDLRQLDRMANKIIDILENFERSFPTDLMFAKEKIKNIEESKQKLKEDLQERIERMTQEMNEELAEREQKIEEIKKELEYLNAVYEKYKTE